MSIQIADTEDRLNLCESLIDYTFQDRTLLVAALTHASGADNRLSSNERLEFLGDSVLGLVVCELLYQRFPDYLEGDLTKIKSVVVSRRTCARVSEALGLEKCLILGKGMSTSPKLPPSLLSDVFESLVAAIYLDRGLEAARSFIVGQMDAEIDSAVSGDSGGNYKSQLQQFAQREYKATPAYHLLDEKGPDHSKCFKMAAQIAGTRYPAAWGRNKKEAEQRAACNALREMNDLPIKYPSD